MEQKKYHSIVRYGHKSTQNVLNKGDNIIIQEKIDGCFQYDTRVTLADGSTEKIGVIVNNKMDVEVMSYNFDKGVFEPKRITNWYNHGAKKDFIAIKVASVNGSRPNRIICTPDHLFYTNLGWVEAKNLSKEHILYTCNKRLNEIQQQMILGTLLGDASVYPNKKGETQNRGIAYNHSLKQKEYVYFKNKIMGEFHRHVEPYISGFGSDGLRSRTSCTITTNEIIKICIKNDKKTVNKEWLNRLSTVGLAFWYMDDGSLAHNDGQRDRATLHTQGFLESEVDLIIDHLFNSWGLKSSKVASRGADGCGFSIALDTNSSDKFFTMIAPYVCNSMKYKLPEAYRTSSCFLDDLENVCGDGLIEVAFIEHCDLPSYRFTKDNYDLEVEDNHNYLANGILVHNSNASFAVINGKLKCWSRRHELGVSDTLGGFYTWAKQNLNVDKLLEGVVYFGEWTNPHKVRYENYTKQFFLYDIYNTHLEEYVSFSMVRDEAKRLNLQLVPVFFEGEFESFEQLNSYVGRTDLGGKLGDIETGEGIVVKNVSYRDRYGKQLFVKLVTEQFAEVQKQRPPKDPKREISPEELKVRECTTIPRVEKQIFIMIEDGLLDPNWGIEDMGKILKHIHPLVAEDIIKEEMQEDDVTIKDIQRFMAKVLPFTIKEIIKNKSELF